MILYTITIADTGNGNKGIIGEIGLSTPVFGVHLIFTDQVKSLIWSYIQKGERSLLYVHSPVCGWLNTSFYLIQKHFRDNEVQLNIYFI